MDIDLEMLKIRIGNLKANTNNLKFSLEDMEEKGVEEIIYVALEGTGLMPRKVAMSKISIACGIECEIRKNEIALTKMTRRFEIETKRQQAS